MAALGKKHEGLGVKNETEENYTKNGEKVLKCIFLGYTLVFC